MNENEVEILLRDMQEYRELTDRVKAIYGDQIQDILGSDRNRKMRLLA